MPETLNALFYDIILLNECGGSLTVASRFSDPDGVRSGKSGWSFGPCQFDTKNNEKALVCLRECGFTEDEIQGVVNQTIDVKPLQAKLRAHMDIVERYSTEQLKYCLDKALNFELDNGIPVQSPDGILAGADYVNQYGSQGNGARNYYRSLGRPVTAKDVLKFKLTNTQYGKEHPDDCERRYMNIVKVLKNAGYVA